jgi:hypothetical protein
MDWNFRLSFHMLNLGIPSAIFRRPIQYRHSAGSFYLTYSCNIYAIDHFSLQFVFDQPDNYGRPIDEGHKYMNDNHVGKNYMCISSRPHGPSIELYMDGLAPSCRIMCCTSDHRIDEAHRQRILLRPDSGRACMQSVRFSREQSSNEWAEGDNSFLQLVKAPAPAQK